MLVGDAGSDELWGGAGADRFVFASANDARWDTIADLESGDLIDLSAIDANTRTKGHQAFSFIGDATFDGHAGQLRVAAGAGGWTEISGDMDGNGIADFVFYLGGAATLGQADFLL